MDSPSVPLVDAVDAARLVGTGAVLLDVREPQEWVAGHAPQAEHLPLAALPVAAGRCRAGDRVVVVCRSGSRARTATALLRRRGVEAWTLDGGMTAWAGAGGPVVTSGGAPGQVV